MPTRCTSSYRAALLSKSKAKPNPSRKSRTARRSARSPSLPEALRTATVRAIRDGVVVGLTRADFDEISSRSPAIWTAVTATLAERLAAATRRATQGNRDAHTVRAQPRPRTIALLGAGGAQIPPTFLTAFVEVARSASGNACRFERHDRRRARRPIGRRSRSHRSTERARKPVFHGRLCRRP